MPTFLRSSLCILLAALVAAPSAFAFQSPLSDESIREAYFLGQRHDGSFANSLSFYAKQLPMPKSGPHISSIEFHTPFLQLVQEFDSHRGNYSAQQALLDHRGQPEFVKILVHIRLTASYSAILSLTEGKDKSSPPQIVRRPFDFWRDFKVQVSNGTQPLSPSSLEGHAESSCGRRGGPRSPTGATIELDFPADAFSSDSADILITLPGGDQVSIDFDLLSLR
jgi:hypothetical protein